MAATATSYERRLLAAADLVLSADAQDKGTRLPDLGVTADLKPHQLHGVAWLIRRYRLGVNVVLGTFSKFSHLLPIASLQRWLLILCLFRSLAGDEVSFHPPPPLITTPLPRGFPVRNSGCPQLKPPPANILAFRHFIPFAYRVPCFLLYIFLIFNFSRIFFYHLLYNTGRTKLRKKKNSSSKTKGTALKN
jgi:hypothetical protein